MQQHDCLVVKPNYLCDSGEPFREYQSPDYCCTFFGARLYWMERKSYLEELEGIPFDSEALDRTKTPQDIRNFDLEILSDKVLVYLQKLNASSEVSIQLNKPLLWYIRSAETLYKQAAIYRREGDLEKAYILFMKYSILVLREMPKHGQYKLSDHASLISTLKALCVGALDYLEKLKRELRDQYSKKYREFSDARASAVPDVQKQVDDGTASNNKASWILRQKDIERFNNEQSQAKEGHTKVSMAPISPVPRQTDILPVFTPESINRKLREVSDRFSIQTQPELVAPTFPSVTNSCILWMIYILGFSENGKVLREVRIPYSIVEDFLRVAQSNTNRNLETCGIVAGHLVPKVVYF